MRVLVTGGAGYIGSHVVRTLLEGGDLPVVYDNLSTGHAEAVRECELIEGDVRDREKLIRVLRKFRFDGAVHLAALSLVGVSMREPAQYFDNNVVGGLSLFDSLVAAEIPWIVISSTAAVYGEPTVSPIPETHGTLPTNPYGESKLMLERILNWYEAAYGLRSIALRYFNAAGAHPNGDIGEDHNPETHLIPIIMQAALGVRAGIDVFGTDYPTPDGTAMRDYVHVCDLASAHLLSMKSLAANGRSGTYNLGSQQGYSVQEIIASARVATGKDIPVRHAPRRLGDPAVLVAESARVRRDFGWRPVYDLDSILRTAWNWHSTHPRGFKS